MSRPIYTGLKSLSYSESRYKHRGVPENKALGDKTNEKKKKEEKTKKGEEKKRPKEPPKVK